jgi:hypothetical protein
MFNDIARIASAAFLSLILTTIAVAGTLGSEGAGIANGGAYASIQAESANG